MEVWVVGIFIECEKCKSRWLLKGIYETEKLAIEACAKDNYFIGPMILNEAFGGDELVKWEGSYYPLAETKEQAIKRWKEQKLKI